MSTRKYLEVWWCQTAEEQGVGGVSIRVGKKPQSQERHSKSPGQQRKRRDWECTLSADLGKGGKGQAHTGHQDGTSLGENVCESGRL